MRWEQGRRSENIEDRRGMPARRSLVQGGIGTIIFVLVVAYFLGIDPTPLLQGVAVDSTGDVESTAEPAPVPAPGQTVGQTVGKDPEVEFVSAVLADTEDTWDSIFRDTGSTYKPPMLVLFRGTVDSACGFAEAAMGPFYCPGDRKVYLDLDFFRELRDRFQAPGDFAEAYVIAHEIGHHVQNLNGDYTFAQKLLEDASRAEANQISVMAELQADCYAGVWAHHADRSRHILEKGDVEEALAAATAIGDDTLQKQTRGYVMPDTFTHGTSAQRVRWFRIGLTKGDMESCETFATPPGEL